jgi:signal transduction histidine kinase
MREGYLDQQRIFAREASRAREERLRTVGQLTAGVAHDFNNTMTAVLGHLELFSHTEDKQMQRDCVYAARQSANRAVDLTQQLLAYARKAPLERTMRDLIPMLTEVAQDHEAVHEGRLEIDFPDALHELAPFWVDGGRLQSAVANLLKNAEEALAPGVSVQLSAALDLRHDTSDTQSLPKGTYVAISVSDNGSGISVEDLDRVTEPFWSTKGHANGSGLGLAMAHGFAKPSGGRLDIQSKHGQGTVVTLRLPYTI